MCQPGARGPQPLISKCHQAANTVTQLRPVRLEV